MVACERRFWDIVKLLLQHRKLDVNRKSKVIDIFDYLFNGYLLFV